MILGIEPDRIEGIARRLDADRALDLPAPSVSSASANTNGFDIDWMVKGTSDVADLVDVTVERWRG